MGLKEQADYWLYASMFLGVTGVTVFALMLWDKVSTFLEIRRYLESVKMRDKG